MAEKIVTILASAGLMATGTWSLMTAVQKTSYMEKLKRKGITSARNYSRGFFLLLAFVFIYCGILLMTR